MTLGSRQAWSRSASVASWLLLFPLLFVLWYRAGAPPVAGDGLDPSWTWAMARAFEKGLRWGHDIVFTFGPLGFLHPHANHWGPTADIYRCAQIAITLVQAFLAVSLFSQLDNRRRLALLAATTACAIAVSGDVMWIIVPVFSLLAILYRSADTTASPLRLVVLVAIASAYTALVVSIKVSFIPLTVLWWLGACTILVLNRRIGAALLCLVSTPAALVAFWLLAGQEIGDLAAHYRFAFEISAAYGAVMGGGAVWYIELVGAALISACAVLVMHALWVQRSVPASLVAVAYIGATMFLAWRSGYTRADMHTTIFFACAAFLIPQLPRAPGSRSWWPAVAAMLVGVGGAFMFVYVWHVDGQVHASRVLQIGREQLAMNWRALTDRDANKALFADVSARMAQSFALPAISAEVGSRSIDLLGYQQAIFAANPLNYTPRPVFQSYAAYSPPLARINEAFLLGDDAPDYVMLPSAGPIDAHYPAMDDSLALIALLRRYTPVLVESQYLLLKKAAPPQPPFAIAPPESGAAASLGEWIDVPQGERPTVLAFAVNLSAAGKAVSFLLREPVWRMEIVRSDGSTQSFRVSRPGGRTGFIVTPLAVSIDDWVSVFLREDAPRAMRFRLLAQSERLAFLAEPGFTYAFTTLDDSTRPATSDPRIVEMLLPGFSQRPTRRTGDVRKVDEDAQPALFTHAPSILTFDVAAGSYVIDGDAGILKAALSAPGCAHADGVAISIQPGDGAAVEVLRLDPFANRAAPNPAHFVSPPVTLATAGTIAYKVDAGGAANPTCDWAYVRNLKIVPSGTSQQ